MIQSEQQIRWRLRELAKQEMRMHKFEHQLFLIRQKQGEAYGNAQKTAEIASALNQLLNLVEIHQTIVRSNTQIKILGKDKNNSTVQGLLGTLRGQSNKLSSKLNKIKGQIKGLIQNGGGQISNDRKIAMTLARTVEHFEGKHKDGILGTPDDALVMIVLLISVVKEWMKPFKR